MATETKTLQDERAEKIAAVEAEDAIIESVFGRKDTKSNQTRLSAGGRKAVRMHEIRELELALAMEGENVEPYQSKRLGKVRQNARSQTDIEQALAAARKVLATTPFDSTKKTAQQRIDALLKTAQKLGYTVA